MQAKPQAEHRWLQKLVGEWTSEMDAPAAPGQPAEKLEGTETVRALGELWVLCEGRGPMPGGGEAHMLMTLGYDPGRGRFVGSWVGSMMTHLWVYDGTLDFDANRLTLESEGPAFSGDGTLARYRDVVEFVTDDHRTLTSSQQRADGSWQPFMTAHYRRRTK